MGCMDNQLMIPLAEETFQAWHVFLHGYEDGQYRCTLSISTGITGDARESYEFSGSSTTLFQELLTVLDATIWSCLAIDDEVLGAVHPVKRTVE